MINRYWDISLVAISVPSSDSIPLAQINWIAVVAVATDSAVRGIEASLWASDFRLGPVSDPISDSESGLAVEALQAIEGVLLPEEAPVSRFLARQRDRSASDRQPEQESA